MPCLHRDDRGVGRRKFAYGLAPLFGARAEMRAEVASYSVQLSGKGLIWLRRKEEGFERSPLVIVREDQLFVFYSPALAGNTLQRSCSVGSFLWEPFDSQWEWEWDSPISSLPRVDVLLASTFPLWRLAGKRSSSELWRPGNDFWWPN